MINHSTACALCSVPFDDVILSGKKPSFFFSGRKVSKGIEFSTRHHQQRHPESVITKRGIRVEPCGCEFHQKCIKKVVKQSYICPVEQLEMVKTTPVNIVDKPKQLRQAIKTGDLNHVKNVLATGKKQDFLTRFKTNPLTYAVKREAYPIVAELLRNGFTTSNEQTQYTIAYMYHHGIALDANLGEAFKWYHQAAKKWHMESWLQIGKMYLTGEGVDKDPVRAMKWLKKYSTIDVSGESLFLIGKMHQEGIGTHSSGYAPVSNPQAAYAYFKYAAVRGHPEAQYYLGLMCLDGSAGFLCPREAVYWLEQAALKGIQVAKDVLQRCTD